MALNKYISAAAEEQGSHPIRNQIRDGLQFAFVSDEPTHHFYITSFFAILVGLSLLVLGHNLDGIGLRADVTNRCRCLAAGVHFRKTTLHICHGSDIMRCDQARPMDVNSEALKMKQCDRATDHTHRRHVNGQPPHRYKQIYVNITHLSDPMHQRMDPIGLGTTPAVPVVATAGRGG